MGGAGGDVVGRGRRPPPSHFTHRSRHSMFSLLLCFMPCSCKILLIWIEFCWWWISFNHLLSNCRNAVALVSRARCVCVGVSALSTAAVAVAAGPAVLSNLHRYNAACPCPADCWPCSHRVPVNYILTWARTMLSQGHHANTTVHILFRDTLVLMEHNQVKASIELTLLFSFTIE